MEYKELIDAALKCGAAKATILDGEQVVLSETFRTICESNQCGGYGRCWMCPPYIGEIHSLMEKVRSYKKVLWFQTIRDIEDSYDIEGMFEAGARHAQVSLALREAVAPILGKDFLLLSCGGCHLCETCAKKEEKPYEGTEEEKKARLFLATLGIDYDKLTPEEFVTQINILKKSEHLKSPNNQRGKAVPYPVHGKGNRKKRK